MLRQRLHQLPHVLGQVVVEVFLHGRLLCLLLFLHGAHVDQPVGHGFRDDGLGGIAGHVGLHLLGHGGAGQAGQLPLEIGHHLADHLVRHLLIHLHAGHVRAAGLVTALPAAHLAEVDVRLGQRGGIEVDVQAGQVQLQFALVEGERR